MNDFYFENKLINEKSPYLLQHAHNPVNWYPWGEEAVSLAKQQNKPIFLSIGHVSSSWTQLLPEESFKKEDIADLMNLNFINVKMDKEEYPHLADLYLDFFHMLLPGSLLKNTWPLNIILTPDLFPFLSVYYLPIEENVGMDSVLLMIEKIVSLWDDFATREFMILQSQKMVEVLSLMDTQMNKSESPLEISDCISLIYKELDLVNGGVNSFPKYLHVNLLRCLLNFSAEKLDSKSLFFVHRSLDRISKGAIHDHIGGGFYRYVVDDKWLLPSLEKIVTENASLGLLFLEAYALTNKEDYKHVALSTLNYLTEEVLDSVSSLFYLSENTGDSAFEGNKSYLHTCSYNEIHVLLGEDADLFCDYFGIYKEGIFNGRNMLRRPDSFEESLLAEKYNLRISELKEKIQGLLRLMKTLRDKDILGQSKNIQYVTYVNAFVAYSLIQAGLLSGQKNYIDISENIMKFLQKNMFKNDVLLRIWRDPESKIQGCLEDYASMILSGIVLFEAGRGIEWLQLACSLMKIVRKHFLARQGGFYSNHDQDPYVILRRCDFIDKALPSGNALMVEALTKFYFLFDDTSCLKEAQDILELSKTQMKINLLASTSFINLSLKIHADNVFKLIILLDEGKSYKEDLESIFLNLYLPNKVVVWIENNDLNCMSLFPKSIELKLLNEKTTIFILEKNKSSRFIDPKSLKSYLSTL